MNPNHHNLIVLQLNIRGLISHKTDLHQLLNTLKLKNSTVDVVLLCETFLNGTTVKQVHIPGYTLISNHRRQYKGGGTAILVREGITFTRKSELDTFIEKHVESVFIEILTKSHKHIIIGSMYRPPNNTDDSFLESILKLRHKLSITKEKKELIIRMDHNYDLLKSNEHKKTEEFLELLINRELFPTITHPTRITKSSATLIDNIFVSTNLHKNSDSAILINDMSDHMPVFNIIETDKTQM